MHRWFVCVGGGSGAARRWWDGQVCCVGEDIRSNPFQIGNQIVISNRRSNLVSNRVTNWRWLAFFRGTTPWLYGLLTEPSLWERVARVGVPMCLPRPFLRRALRQVRRRAARCGGGESGGECGSERGGERGGESGGRARCGGGESSVEGGGERGGRGAAMRSLWAAQRRAGEKWAATRRAATR